MKFFIPFITAYLSTAVESTSLRANNRLLLNVVADGEPREYENYPHEPDLYLYRAGNSNTNFRGYLQAAAIYMNIDCTNDILCLYVESLHANVELLDSPDDLWIKQGPNKWETASPLAFKRDARGRITAWEQCFKIPGDANGFTSISDVRIHTQFQVEGLRETDTGATSPTNRRESLNLNRCDDLDEDGNPKFGPASGQGGGGSEGGGGYGDPHFKTWFGRVYDFHGQCDMILAKSKNYANGMGMEIQVRTEIRRDWSFISEAVVRVGDDTLEIGGHGSYFINSVAGGELSGEMELPSIGGLPLHYSNYGARRHRFEIDLGSESKIVIKVYNEFLAVNIYQSEGVGLEDSIGMMGSFENGELLGRQGQIITNPVLMGFEWQVRDTEKSLFRESKGPQYPEVCQMPSPEAIERRRLQESMVSYEEAVAACEGFEEEIMESCIFDVLSTGDLALAEAGAM